MSERLTIRGIEPADYDAIVQLWCDSGLSVRLRGRDAREPFLQQLQTFPATYLLAELDGVIVGTVLGTHDGRKGWINRLAVHPERRRRGIAQQLIRACEEALKEQGIEIFAALTETDNEVSTRVLERADYVRDVPVHYLRKRLRDDI
jgi:ribosomal protein S18 acetylase RimI-like enzyme